MYTFNSRIRYSETDSESRLTLPALLNYFQDASTFQSEDLGLGVGYMKEHHQAWVLASWQIVIERLPMLGEAVEIGTKPYEFKGFLGSRNFWMTDAEGQYLAKANSLWTLLNVETGRPTPAPEEMVESYGVEPKLDMEYTGRKIALPQQMDHLEQLVVRRQHLDSNHHVNNGQFIQIAADYLPEHFVVKQLRAEYRQQAFLHDIMVPCVGWLNGCYTVALNDLQGKPYAIVEFTGHQEEIC